MDAIALTLLPALAGGILFLQSEIETAFADLKTASAVEERAVVMNGNAPNEFDSRLPKELVRDIGALDEVARSTMWSLASGESLIVRDANFDRPFLIPIRGVRPEAELVRDGIELLEGGRFRYGAHEAIIGNALWLQLGSPSIGTSLRFDDREWTLTGRFSCGDRLAEHEVWVDLAALDSAEIPDDGIASIHVRLASTEALDSFQESVAALAPDAQVVRRNELIERHSREIEDRFHLRAKRIGSLAGATLMIVGAGLLLARNPAKGRGTAFSGDYRPHLLFAALAMGATCLITVTIRELEFIAPFDPQLARSFPLPLPGNMGLAACISLSVFLTSLTLGWGARRLRNAPQRRLAQSPAESAANE